MTTWYGVTGCDEGAPVAGLHPSAWANRPIAGGEEPGAADSSRTAADRRRRGAIILPPYHGSGSARVSRETPAASSRRVDLPRVQRREEEILGLEGSVKVSVPSLLIWPAGDMAGKLVLRVVIVRANGRDVLDVQRLQNRMRQPRQSYAVRNDVKLVVRVYDSLFVKARCQCKTHLKDRKDDSDREGKTGKRSEAGLICPRMQRQSIHKNDAF